MIGGINMAGIKTDSTVWLNLNQAAEMLGLSTYYVKGLTEQGELKKYKFGVQGWLLSYKEVMAYKKKLTT